MIFFFHELNIIIIICSFLKFVVSEHELGRAAVLEETVLDALELGDVVLVYLGVGPLVAEGSYHLIYSVMQPQDVCVRLEILPIISVDKGNKY